MNLGGVGAKLLGAWSFHLGEGKIAQLLAAGQTVTQFSAFLSPDKPKLSLYSYGLLYSSLLQTPHTPLDLLATTAL